jgi:hypothetical protein
MKSGYHDLLCGLEPYATGFILKTSAARFAASMSPAINARATRLSFMASS